MTQEKSNTKNRIILFIFILVIIYFLYNLLNSSIGSKEKTVLPEIGTLYSKTNAQGITIKDETVYYADSSGQLSILIDEGERVAFGEEITSININKDNSSIINEIDIIDDKIERLASTGSKSLIINDSNKGKEESIKTIMNDLQTSINDKKYDEIEYNIDYLKGLSNDYKEDATLLDISLSSLQLERDKLIAQLDNKMQKYNARETGIVSYHIDGYEKIFIPKEFDNYTYEKLFIDEINAKSIIKKEIDNNFLVSSGQAIFKIIDNFKWYLAIMIEDLEDIKEYEVGESILIEFEDGTELEGKIIAVNITNEKAVIVVKFGKYLHEIYNIRIPVVNIINSRKEGLKIPSNVIIEKEGNKGVFIKDISGIVLFKQISTLGEEGEYTYIDKGNSNGYINNDNGDFYKTINLYDELFLDPSSVTEGEILK